jgi:hypothetical protein
MIDPIDSGPLSEAREHDAGDGTPYHQLSAAVLKISSAAMVEDWEVKVRRRRECLADTIMMDGRSFTNTAMRAESAKCSLFRKARGRAGGLHARAEIVARGS